MWLNATVAQLSHIVVHVSSLSDAVKAWPRFVRPSLTSNVVHIADALHVFGAVTLDSVHWERSNGLLEDVA